MANNFYYCGFIILKMVDFLVDSDVFWNTQNASDCTILIKKNPKEHAIGPPSAILNPHHYRATYTPGMYYLIYIKKRKASIFVKFLWLLGAL